MAYLNLSGAHIMLEQYEAAEQVCERAIQEGYGEYFIWGNLAEAQFLSGGPRPTWMTTYEKALALAKKQLKINPRDVEVMGEIAKYHAVLGQREQALEYSAMAQDLGKPSAELLFTFALIYNQLNDQRMALQWLERAVGAGFSETWIRDTPILKSLHSNEGFARLLDNP